MSFRVGIVGVSGYTGVELLRIVSQHPDLNVSYAAAGRAAGVAVTNSWPGLTGLLDHLQIEAFDVATCAERCDVVFLALPHGIAASVARQLLDAKRVVVDLGADFRLRDPAVYERFYRLEHPSPDLLTQATYGLVELQREALRGATLIANPGCYPTAVALAAAPLVEAGLTDGWLIADCLSGVSGAGRKAGSRNLFCEVAESAGAYGMAGSHRHVPEIEQTLGISVTFTPHLVPMVRGMVATVHTRPGTKVSSDELSTLYAERYDGEAMITLRDTIPRTADVRGSNRAHIHPAIDTERGVISVTCVIDNLLKGASGQAVQALNVALGLPETRGLPMFPVLP